MEYFGYGWWPCTYQAALDRELSMMQNCNQGKLDAYTRMAMSTQNAFNPLQTCKEEVEEEPVKKKISVFEIRVGMWHAVNEEITRVEEFLCKASTKKKSSGLFRVSCFEKNRKGFTVNADYNMELPLGLQEKMVRAAEEYLEELKKQREDMDRGYE